MNCDSILFIGFGGPTKPDEIVPFLRNVTRGRNIPDARLTDVAHHYEIIGGRSPYNELTLCQVNAFKNLAVKKGLDIPVYLGMRNWDPYLKSAVMQMKNDGVCRAIGFILAPHRSYSSFQQYQENVEAAKKEAAFPGLDVDYVDAWHDHPLYIEAVSDRVREKLSCLKENNADETLLIFTAHSIPMTMAKESQYEKEIMLSARLIAEKLGRKRWTTAYQSRSGRPGDSWLEPDINDVFAHAYQHGVRNVLVIPVGFLCDHAEVLFDLDHEAKATAEKFGLHYVRAATVMDHPKFIEMIFKVVAR